MVSVIKALAFIVLTVVDEMDLVFALTGVQSHEGKQT